MMHRNHPVSEYRTVVDDSTQFLDVRQPDEVAESAIPGALNIPLDLLPEKISDLDPARRVVVLCRSGGRSTMAAEMLTAHGFSDVVNLAGGMLAYSE